MQNTKGTEYSSLKGIKKTLKSSLVKQTCKKQAECPRTQFRDETSFLQVRENSPSSGKALSSPCLYHVLKSVPARQGEERQSYSTAPQTPKSLFHRSENQVKPLQYHVFWESQAVRETGEMPVPVQNQTSPLSREDNEDKRDIICQMLFYQVQLL